MKAFILLSPTWGVYLGCCLGMGFWSKLEDGGQDCAVTFTDERQALKHMATWPADAKPQDFELVEVEALPDGYATMAACIKAGATGWLTADMPTVGPMQ